MRLGEAVLAATGVTWNKTIRGWVRFYLIGPSLCEEKGLPADVIDLVQSYLHPASGKSLFWDWALWAVDRAPVC